MPNTTIYKTMTGQER